MTGINTGKPKIPKRSTLFQNYPNPFNPTTVMRYNLYIAGFTKLTIFDLTGQEVVTLVNEYQSAGEHQIVWRAYGLASGTYFYKLGAGDSPTNSEQEFSETKKLLLLK